VQSQCVNTQMLLLDRSDQWLLLGMLLIELELRMEGHHINRRNRFVVDFSVGERKTRCRW
jgi:hypothetical protein